MLQVAALFLALALILNLAVHGWLGAVGAWSTTDALTGGRLAHLFITGTFPVLAASTWYALAFVVRLFG
jgi:hypothetical protein